MQEGKNRSSEDQKKRRLVTLKGLKQGDGNELERKLRPEKVVNNKHLRLAMETEQEEQDWRMMQLPIGSVAHVDG